jgi:cell wall-associated NlpC family hydrolase
MNDLQDLVGVPWVAGGRDPRVGLDCLGLVLEAARRRGLPAEEPADALERVAQVQGWSIRDDDFPGDWRPVEPPYETNDVLLLPGWPLAGENHLGYVAGEGWVIHATRTVGVVLTRLETLQRHTRRGYRWRGPQ